MNLVNKVAALLAFEEDGEVVKTIRFFLRPKMTGLSRGLTTFERTFDSKNYMLALYAGGETVDLEQYSAAGIPWISICLPQTVEVSDNNLPDFLSSFISEDRLRKQIQDHITSFITGR